MDVRTEAFRRVSTTNVWRTRLTRASLRALLLVLPYSITANAADASGDDADTLATVVVTAQRRTENIQEVPLSVTAISSATIENFSMQDFPDYARTVPNLAFGLGGSDEGVTSGLNVTIRGIVGGVASYDQNTTSFYIDDTPVPLFLDPRVLDLERIEILRGPQGTLFGSSAMGGTIRLITRQPDPQSSYGSIDVQGFDINHGGAGYDLTGVYNLPLVRDELALRISGYSSYKPGIFTLQYGIATSPGYTVPPSQPEGEETHVGSVTEYGGMLSLTYTPTAVPGLSITPMTIYQDMHGNGLPLADYTPSNLVQVRPLYFAEGMHYGWSFTSLTAKYAAAFGAFISSSSWFNRNSFDTENGAEIVSSVAAYAPPPLNSTLSYTYLPSPGPAWLDSQSFTQELRFESALRGPLQFILGGFYQSSDSHKIEAELEPYSGSDPFFYEDNPQSNREIAAFADLTYSISALELSAGVRYAELRYSHAYVAYGWINGGPSSSETGDEEHALTPRFTAKYQITPDAMVYGSAAKGYRIGGANSALPEPLCEGQGPANGVYTSDSLWSYEVGSKNTLWDGRINTRVAAFWIDWRDIQQNILLECGYSIVENAGAATSKGVELEANMAPARGLNLTVSAGYDNAKITSPGAPGSSFTVGEPLNGVPAWNASLLGEYTVPTTFGASFIRLKYTYTGSSISYSNTPVGRPRDAYSIVDLHLGVSTGPWDVSLFGTNLFDVRANLGDEGPETGELPGRPRWFIGQPRTIGIEIRRAFNAQGNP